MCYFNGTILRKFGVAMIYQWKISKYRRDKRVGALSPVKRSDYVQHLFDMGVGWNGQAANRKHTEGLCMDDQRDQTTKRNA